MLILASLSSSLVRGKACKRQWRSDGVDNNENPTEAKMAPSVRELNVEAA